MSAPNVCDGTSAVGESRHRILWRIRWSIELNFAAELRRLTNGPALPD